MYFRVQCAPDVTSRHDEGQERGHGSPVTGHTPSAKRLCSESLLRKAELKCPPSGDGFVETRGLESVGDLRLG